MKHVHRDLSKPLKIYLIADNFHPCYDGMTKTTHTLALGLYERGYDVTVICPTKKGYIDEVPYKVMRTPSYMSKGEYPVAKRHFSKENKKELDYDGPMLFNAQSPFIMSHLALRYAKKNNIPFIGTTHTKYKDDYLGMTKSRFITYLLLKYTVSFYQSCTSLIGISPSASRVLKEYGVKKDITTITTGIDYPPPEDSNKYINQIKKKYELKESDNILLFVGHLTWQKGIKLILDSIKVAEEKYHMTFISFFVGDGDRRDEIIKYKDSLKLNSRTIFTGKIDDINEFKCMYLVSDIFFFPSTFDTLGLVIHEAASLGVPSLLIRGSDAASFTVDNHNGYLADNNSSSMADKLRYIFTNKKDIKGIGENAKKEIPQSRKEALDKTIKEFLLVVDSFYKK